MSLKTPPAVDGNMSDGRFLVDVRIEALALGLQ